MKPVEHAHSLPGEAARTARWFHAVSDPVRVQILEMVSHRARRVWELERALDTAQSRLSFHLKVLKEAGLFRACPDGSATIYEIQPEALDAMTGFIQSLNAGNDVHRCVLECCQGRTLR